MGAVPSKKPNAVIIRNPTEIKIENRGQTDLIKQRVVKMSESAYLHDSDNVDKKSDLA